MIVHRLAASRWTNRPSAKVTMTVSMLLVISSSSDATIDKRAKERQKRKPADSVMETFPEQNDTARDEAGEVFGVSRLAC